MKMNSLSFLFFIFSLIGFSQAQSTDCDDVIREIYPSYNGLQKLFVFCDKNQINLDSSAALDTNPVCSNLDQIMSTITKCQDCSVKGGGLRKR